jgi:hypothetical protein
LAIVIHPFTNLDYSPSPIAKSAIPLSANILFKLEATNKAALDIHSTFNSCKRAMSAGMSYMLSESAKIKTGRGLKPLPVF